MRFFYIQSAAAGGFLFFAAASAANCQTIAGFNGGAGYGALNNGSGAAASYINNSTLQLTQDTNASQANSVFYATPVNINYFTAQFTYQATDTTGTPGDGIAFVIQDDSRGTAAIGNAGHNLGFSISSGSTSGTAIQNGVAVGLNLVTNYTVGTNVFTTSSGIPTTSGAYNATGTVNLNSDDPIRVIVGYSAASQTLTETLTDTTTSNSYSTSYTNTNLTSLLGGHQTAYVGFSGSDGAYMATQNISNFSFSGSATAPEPCAFVLIAVAGLPLAARWRTRAAR